MTAPTTIYSLIKGLEAEENKLVMRRPASFDKGQRWNQVFGALEALRQVAGMVEAMISELKTVGRKLDEGETCVDACGIHWFNCIELDAIIDEILKTRILGTKPEETYVCEDLPKGSCIGHKIKRAEGE